MSFPHAFLCDCDVVRKPMEVSDGKRGRIVSGSFGCLVGGGDGSKGHVCSLCEVIYLLNRD